MESKYYFRIIDNDYGFVIKGISEIKETDIKISEEDYNNYFELQSQGKQFRLKKEVTREGLFGYIEEFIPEIIEETVDLSIDEFMLDTDYRLSILELGVE